MFTTILATLLAVSGLCSTTASEPSSRPTGFVPVCREPYYNFGEVWADDQTIEHEFEVENIGTETGCVELIDSAWGSAPRSIWTIHPGQTVRIPTSVRISLGMRGPLSKQLHLYVVSCSDGHYLGPRLGFGSPATMPSLDDN